jgi:ParB family transcriptional regulator, chromosome partitioning protein
MTASFTPTTENFFSKVSKRQIADCLKEVGKPLSGEAMNLKKAGLAALAEREVRGAGWLPEPIRVSTERHDVSDAIDADISSM